MPLSKLEMCKVVLMIPDIKPNGVNRKAFHLKGILD